MNLPYIINVAVILLACLAFYKLLLRRETFYKMNRFFLITCLAVSFALPLLQVPQELSFREPVNRESLIVNSEESIVNSPQSTVNTNQQQGADSKQPEAINEQPLTNNDQTKQTAINNSPFNIRSIGGELVSTHTCIILKSSCHLHGAGLPGYAECAGRSFW